MVGGEATTGIASPAPDVFRWRGSLDSALVERLGSFTQNVSSYHHPSGNLSANAIHLPPLHAAYQRFSEKTMIIHKPCLYYSFIRGECLERLEGDIVLVGLQFHRVIV